MTLTHLPQFPAWTNQNIWLRSQSPKLLPPYPVVHLQPKWCFFCRFATDLLVCHIVGATLVSLSSDRQKKRVEMFQTQEFSVIIMWPNHVRSKSWLDSTKTGPIPSEINRLFRGAVWILGVSTCCGTDSFTSSCTVSFLCNRDLRDIPNFSFFPPPKTIFLSPSLSLRLSLSACLPLFYKKLERSCELWQQERLGWTFQLSGSSKGSSRGQDGKLDAFSFDIHTIVWRETLLVCLFIYLLGQKLGILVHAWLSSNAGSSHPTITHPIVWQESPWNSNLLHCWSHHGSSGMMRTIQAGRESERVKLRFHDP